MSISFEELKSTTLSSNQKSIILTVSLDEVSFIFQNLFRVIKAHKARIINLLIEKIYFFALDVLWDFIVFQSAERESVIEEKKTTSIIKSKVLTKYAFNRHLRPFGQHSL